MKRCIKCGEDKPLSAFFPRKDSRDGYRNNCKDCHRVKTRSGMRLWRATNPSRNRELARDWRERHIDQERERYRRYDEAHREQRRLAIAKSRAANPEHHRALRKKWREENIEIARKRCRIYWHRRRTGSDPAPEIDAYAELLLLQACAYCGSTDSMTIDHVVPVSRGGKHVIENLLPACQPCNSSKGTKLLEEWLPSRAA